MWFTIKDVNQPVGFDTWVPGWCFNIEFTKDYRVRDHGNIFSHSL